jgi:hypothetical protein
MIRLVIGTSALLLGVAATTVLGADDAKWVTIKGKVVWEGPVPAQPKIVPGVNQDVCARDKDPLEEDYLINPKNQGLKNVFVWIRPEGLKRDDPFPQDKIHPSLLKPAKPEVEIEQPSCRFVPHALALRAGQKLVIKNNAPVAHNTKWDSNENGNFNPIIEPGKKFELPKPLVAEPGKIVVVCNIHTWMKAHVRIFDHPYYALTDADGQFEIKLAPTGNFNLFVVHPMNGPLNGKAGNKGQPIAIKGDLDVGVLKMMENKSDR